MHDDYQVWKDREHLLRLDRPEREEIMPKEPVLAAIGAGAGMRVADIGAGLGYFALPLARAVSSSGRVFAVDPSPAAQEELRDRALRANLPQVTVVGAAAEATGLDAETIDRVLWHTIYHEIERIGEAIEEMRRILRPGGRWIIVDWVKRDTGMGPRLDHRVTVDDVRRDVETRGLRVEREFQPGPVTWGLVVERP